MKKVLRIAIAGIGFMTVANAFAALCPPASAIQCQIVGGGSQGVPILSGFRLLHGDDCSAQTQFPPFSTVFGQINGQYACAYGPQEQYVFAAKTLMGLSEVQNWNVEKNDQGQVVAGGCPKVFTGSADPAYCPFTAFP